MQKLFAHSEQKNGPYASPELKAYIKNLNQQVEIQSLQIPLEGRSIRALYYRPVEEVKKKDGSVFLYFHGGGWVMGSPAFLQARSIE